MKLKIVLFLCFFQVLNINNNSIVAQLKPINDGLPTKIVSLKSVSANSTTLVVGSENGLFVFSEEENAWKQVSDGGLPKRCRVHAINVSDSRIIASINSSIYESKDNGANWNEINNGLPNFESYYIIAADGNSLVIASFKGIYMSDNNGETWTTSNTGLPSDVNWKCITIKGSTIFAGGSKGIFKTTDKGNSWVSVNKGMPNDYPHTNSIAIRGDNIFAGTAHRGVFLSTDNGTSWSALKIAEQRINSLIFRGADLFAASTKELFVSTDNGNKWLMIRNDLERQIKALSLTAQNNNLYFTTSDGVFKLDQTNKVTPVNNGLPLEICSIHAVAIKGTNFFVSTAKGNFMSNDLGVNWTMIKGGLPVSYIVKSFIVSGDKIIAATPSGLYSSNNDGKTWDEIIGLEEYDYIDIAAVEGAQLFAGTGDGLFTINADSISWSLVNKGLEGDVLSFAKSGSTLYAGTEKGVFISTSDEISWSKLSKGFPEYPYIHSLAVFNQKIFAGTEEGLFVYSKKEKQWVEIKGNGFPEEAIVLSLSVHGNNIFAGTAGSGLYLSNDEGKHWTNINNGINSRTMFDVIAGSGSNVLIGTDKSGVFLSTNVDDFSPLIQDNFKNFPILNSLVSGPAKVGGVTFEAPEKGDYILLRIATSTKGKFVFKSSRNIYPEYDFETKVVPDVEHLDKISEKLNSTIFKKADKINFSNILSLDENNLSKTVHASSVYIIEYKSGNKVYRVCWNSNLEDETTEILNNFFWSVE